MQELTTCQQKELLVLSKNYKSKNQYTGFINNLFDRIIPQAQEDKMQQKSLSNLLKEYGFNPGQHQQIKKDLQSGRIGLAKNRLAINTTIEDVNEDELALQQTIYGNIKYTEIGIKALQNKELAIVTLAGGVGSRWTQGAGVVKSLNPFAKFSEKHRNFIEIHLAKTNKTNSDCLTSLQHIFTTSYLTQNAISTFLTSENQTVKNIQSQILSAES